MESNLAGLIEQLTAELKKISNSGARLETNIITLTDKLGEITSTLKDQIGEINQWLAKADALLKKLPPQPPNLQMKAE